MLFGGVTPALHTPLMAVTNAISGIVIVGAMMVAGGSIEVYDMSNNAFIAKAVGSLGIFLASINIFGGFVVTKRMLAMFKSKGTK